MGGLTAGREMGIETGGTAPHSWLTEDGPQEDLLRGFGLTECDIEGYPARTRRNVIDSDGTLLVGQYQAGGSKLTHDIASQLKKPLFVLAWPLAPEQTQAPAEDFRRWLERCGIVILNVAGNRESDSPGIADFTRQFLLSALAPPK